MGDEIEKNSTEQKSFEYPSTGFPVVFADNTTNAVWGQGVVKWYMTRSEPPMIMSGPTKEQAFAQIVMPFDGFVRTALFFGQILENLISDGLVKKERVEEIRKGWEAKK